MAEISSFTETIKRLRSRSTKRDPKSVRLASVASAITDVIEGDVTAGKVYASVVSTLEGTLHQDPSERNAILDSLATQVALLDILRTTLPYVAPATIAATLALTSRVLRSLVTFGRSITLDQTQGTIFDTKDGLGSISLLLCSSCKTASDLLRHIPTSAEPRAVRVLLDGTLLSLIHDSRENVRRTAQNELCGLLNMRFPSCHAAILDRTTKFVHALLDDYGPKALTENGNKGFVSLLGFLQLSAVAMDFVSIGSRLMKILTSLLTDCSSLSSSSLFLAKSRDASGKILTINAILSTILSIFEHDSSSCKKAAIEEFAARTLASLIQARPALALRDGNAEWDLIESGRTIYGQVTLSTCQHLLREEKPVTGIKLLPLAIQHVVNLSCPSDGVPDTTVADTLFIELAQLFRSHLLPLRSFNQQTHACCTKKCLFILQSILQPRFQRTWTVSLKTLVILLQQMDHGEIDVQTCVQSILKLRKGAIDDKQALEAIDDAFSCLIQGIGIMQFWNLVDLTNLCASSLKTGRPNEFQWLFRLMKVAGSMGAETHMELSFFQEQVLPLARHIDMISSTMQSDSPSLRSLVIDLWLLFPIFCRHPTDLTSSFPKLAPVLVRAMIDDRYPLLVTAICTGLSTLSRGVSNRLNALEELVDEEGAVDVRLEAQVVGKLSAKLLPSLFKLVDTLHVNGNSNSAMGCVTETALPNGKLEYSDRVRTVSQAIASLAQLAPREQIQTLFSKVIQRLLEASQSHDDLSEKMCSLLTLSQALVVSEVLDQASISLLYRSIRPLVRTDETTPRIQKRAYKVLAEICSRYQSFVVERKQLSELVELLTSSAATSQVSARFMRIKCLNLIVNAFGASMEIDKEVVSALVGETLLCLKDSNSKTRDASYLLLLSLAEIGGDPTSLVQMIAAAVASNTTYMRSAALLALSRLVFEYGSKDLGVQTILPSLLKTILLLADDPSREVTKSFIGFVRVSVSALRPEQLQPLLPDILNSLLKYHRGKDRFRQKIKIILKKLVKLFGFDTLEPLVPKSDSRLLTHMRKLSEREARRKSAAHKEPDEMHFDDMVASDEDDSDNGRTLLTRTTRVSRITKPSSKQLLKRHRSNQQENFAQSVAMSRKHRSDGTVRLKNDTDGEVLDLMDSTKKAVRFENSLAENSDSEDSMEFDDTGKLVVPDIDDQASITNEYDEMLGNDRTYSRVSRIDRTARKGRKTHNQKIGASYKAKKAGGDIKRKGQKYDPYAYVPLDGRNYTRKNRTRAVEEMGSVVKRARKRQRR